MTKIEFEEDTWTGNRTAYPQTRNRIAELVVKAGLAKTTESAIKILLGAVVVFAVLSVFFFRSLTDKNIDERYIFDSRTAIPDTDL